MNPTPASTPTPDTTGVASGDGVAISGSGVPVLDVEDVTKTYPGEPLEAVGRT
jgi:hypothetical protein